LRGEMVLSAASFAIEGGVSISTICDEKKIFYISLLLFRTGSKEPRLQPLGPRTPSIFAYYYYYLFFFFFWKELITKKNLKYYKFIIIINLMPRNLFRDSYIFLLPPPSTHLFPSQSCLFFYI
jgi:hypothetical protein